MSSGLAKVICTYQPCCKARNILYGHFFREWFAFLNLVGMIHSASCHQLIWSTITCNSSKNVFFFQLLKACPGNFLITYGCLCLHSFCQVEDEAKLKKRAERFGSATDSEPAKVTIHFFVPIDTAVIYPGFPSRFLLSNFPDSFKFVFKSIRAQNCGQDSLN